MHVAADIDEIRLNCSNSLCDGEIRNILMCASVNAASDKSGVVLCEDMIPEGDVGDIDEGLLAKKAAGRHQKKV